MRNIIAIFKREFLAYFNSAIANICIVAFLLITSAIFFFWPGISFFFAGQATLRTLFVMMPWLFLIFVPAITMRLWAEERESGTVEVLMTLPIKDWEAVLGKYLASFAFLSVMILLTLPLVVITYACAAQEIRPDSGPIWGGYIGSLLMGAAFLAIGSFVSSFAKKQIIAFIGAFGILLVLVLLGINFFMFYFGSLGSAVSYASLLTHFNAIAKGVLDTRDIIYYFSVTGFFLFLTVKTVETGKWR